jgi:hypothetical protein
MMRKKVIIRCLSQVAFDAVKGTNTPNVPLLVIVAIRAKGITGAGYPCQCIKDLSDKES